MTKRDFPVKPIPVDIDTTCRNTANLPAPGGYRIQYQCGQCKNNLCYFLSTKELYCHHCGQKVDWRVITYLNSRMSDDIANFCDSKEQEQKKKLYLSIVTKANGTMGFDEPVFIEEK